MKIHQNRNINTSSTTRRKKVDNNKFGSLFASEMNANTATQEASSEEHHKETATPEQQRAVFKQATELLDQALEQWEVDGILTENTITSIQQARQQLGLLSSQDPALAQAETILAVESKRLQTLNH
ncbi:MAG: hypothetical protein Q9M14_07125 [Mariprofundaceae bacterium]|nr:hypothetical protein [Mariprofundaceae bacterium]